MARRARVAMIRNRGRGGRAKRTIFMSNPVAHFSPCHLKLKRRRQSCFGDYSFPAFANSAWTSGGVRFSDFRIFSSRWWCSVVVAVVGAAPGKSPRDWLIFEHYSPVPDLLFIITFFAFFQHFFDKKNQKLVKNVPSFPVPCRLVY